MSRIPRVNIAKAFLIAVFLTGGRPAIASEHGEVLLLPVDTFGRPAEGRARVVHFSGVGGDGPEMVHLFRGMKAVSVPFGTYVAILEIGSRRVRSEVEVNKPSVVAIVDTTARIVETTTHIRWKSRIQYKGDSSAMLLKVIPLFMARGGDIAIVDDHSTASLYDLEPGRYLGVLMNETTVIGAAVFDLDDPGLETVVRIKAGNLIDDNVRTQEMRR